MKKNLLEKSLVVVLFVLVMVTFSFAERDTKKLFEKYNTKSTVETSTKKANYTSEIKQKAPVEKFASN